jgi:hypothetical protein
MSRDDQIARNLAIAEKFFDGYHHSVARGRLQNVFEKEDFAEEWVFCSPFPGGEVLRRQTRSWRRARSRTAPASTSSPRSSTTARRRGIRVPR